MDAQNPLLLTLTLNPEAQLFFNALRRQHFPPERNFLDAHLMLFHNLPAGHDNILADIEAAAAKRPLMPLQVTDVVSVGKGVAYKIASEPLAELHKYLQHQWKQWTIPQDRQRLWPHITIQNKVTPEEAKALVAKLSESFEPFEICGTGLGLWEYLGGPWRFIRDFPFGN